MIAIDFIAVPLTIRKHILMSVDICRIALGVGNRIKLGRRNGCLQLFREENRWRMHNIRQRPL